MSDITHILSQIESGDLPAAEHTLYDELRKLDEAKLAAATSLLPERHRRTAWLLEELVKLYQRWGKPAESARWQQQLDTIRQVPQQSLPAITSDGGNP